MRHCYEVEKIRRIVLGSGGSAFVDGGFGALFQGMDLFTAYNSQGDVIDKTTFKPHLISDVSFLKINNEEILNDLEIIMPCDV